MLSFFSGKDQETKIQIKYVFNGVTLISANGEKQHKGYQSAVDQTCSSDAMIKLVFDEIAADVDTSIAFILSNRKPISTDTQIIADLSISISGKLHGNKVHASFTTLDSFKEYLQNEKILNLGLQKRV